MRTFKKHEKYRPVVRIDKLKGKVPTVIQVSGRRYVLEHKDRKR
jgi:hypothetical protein